ncbi:cell division protein FtsZ [Ferrovum myxofaciens]|jgi:cell division protein FtsZ|uniref:Cell division protein FtsZ n=3 Tax=root TaxID=1 RepID=A0A149VZG7_9PROT|nr:cell division protein FtsZ [Ferrovum myxofaciens]KXW58612.1 cell division protein FtsZ [Ferrovum myxofaciens]
MANFEIQECPMLDAVIKVIGVGGCGGNAVAHMVEQGVSGVEFIAMNTDSQALRRSRATHQVQLGETLTKGLGAGANPDVGRQAALADRERIAEMVSGADMLFITAGMGGGTGTGAAPIVAEIAREMGILTVAVVTKPFEFEGRRMKSALEGIEQLSQYVDSLIIIPNEKLLQVLGNEVSMLEAYHAANDVLQGAVAGIAEVINCPGMVNVDFADVRTVMSEMGVAMMGSAKVGGIDRANMAAQQAIASPLLEDVNLTGARGVLVNITASASMKLKEVHDVMNTIRSFTAEDATVIFGSVVDETMGDELRVTIVATGLGGSARRAQKPLTVVRTGTDNAPLILGQEGTHASVIRTARNSHNVVEAMRENGVDLYDIPAFLRKQAD